MKLRVASIVILLLLFTLAPAFAIDTPRIVPRIQEIQRPVGEVFHTIKKYFTDASLSHFALVSADEHTHTLVAKQTALDDLTWRTWAFCETGPVQMIYKLQDGTVAVTVSCRRRRRIRRSRPCRRISRDAMRSPAIRTRSIANRNSCSKTRYWLRLAPLPASESMRSD
jgi:hypothetical protein